MLSHDKAHSHTHSPSFLLQWRPTNNFPSIQGFRGDDNVLWGTKVFPLAPPSPGSARQAYGVGRPAKGASCVCCPVPALPRCSRPWQRCTLLLTSVLLAAFINSATGGIPQRQDVDSPPCFSSSQHDTAASLPWPPRQLTNVNNLAFDDQQYFSFNLFTLFLCVYLVWNIRQKLKRK